MENHSDCPFTSSPTIIYLDIIGHKYKFFYNSFGQYDLGKNIYPKWRCSNLSVNQNFTWLKQCLLPVMILNVGAEGIIFSLVHSLVSSGTPETNHNQLIALMVIKNLSGTQYVFSAHIRVEATAKFRIRTEFSSGREKLWLLQVFLACLLSSQHSSFIRFHQKDSLLGKPLQNEDILISLNLFLGHTVNCKVWILLDKVSYVSQGLLRAF